MKTLMSAEERFVLLAELATEEVACELSHGPFDHEQHIAVDYFIQPFGSRDEKGVEECTEMLAIAICADCQEGLSSGDWVLFYCTTCMNSAWCLKELAKHKYNTSVVLMHVCHHCYGESRNETITYSHPSANFSSLFDSKQNKAIPRHC